MAPPYELLVNLGRWGWEELYNFEPIYKQYHAMIIILQFYNGYQLWYNLWLPVQIV